MDAPRTFHSASLTWVGEQRAASTSRGGTASTSGCKKKCVWLGRPSFYLLPLYPFFPILPPCSSSYKKQFLQGVWLGYLRMCLTETAKANID